MVSPVKIDEKKAEVRPDIVPVHMVAYGTAVVLEHHDPGVTDMFYIKGSMRKLDKQAEVEIDQSAGASKCLLMNPKQGSLRFINKHHEVQIVPCNLTYYECKDVYQIYHCIKSQLLRKYLLDIGVNPEKFFREVTICHNDLQT